jgi:nitroreductase
MFIVESCLLEKHKNEIAEDITKWVKENYPRRTNDFSKCTRDLTYIINSLIYCLQDGHITPIDHLSRMFFKRGVLQLKTLHVEFEAYGVMLNFIKEKFENFNPEALKLLEDAIEKLKEKLSVSCTTDNDNISKAADRETRLKHMQYARDEEREIMLNMQKCQRNWDLTKKLPEDAIEYLLWIAQNAPSKQHEAYYDVYYSTDRETIEYLYQYSWGSTHSRTPPSCWRNSQMNAHFYMIFVCKTPPTMYNCNNDGTLQDTFGVSRWENAIVSVGMAMALVMRAANKMGLRTGCNKIKDLGPDYNYEWERKLGIYDDVVIHKTKKLFYGVGIGVPNENRPRWESDDTELAIGASNGYNLTLLDEKDPNFVPFNSKGHPARKVKIVDIKTTRKDVDPYGNVHIIPEVHEIKVNTVKNRDIKVIEIK